MTRSVSDTRRRCDLYRQMVTIRRFEERTLELRRTDTIEGVVHPSIGQEAVAVGVCSQLAVHDRITSTHRGHGHCIAKGADLRRMMAELFGRADGYCRGKGGSMHIADFDIGMLGANGIVAAGLPIAAGAALASAIRHDDGVAVCFFSDGASNEGEFHECLNVSALWGLPIIWLCENNGIASGTPEGEALAASSPATLAQAYGMTSHVVDGNDVEVVADAAASAVSQARAGRGPVFLEARTFRVLAHAYRRTSIPDARSQELIEQWRRRDPIELFRVRLLDEGALDEASARKIDESVSEQIDDAVRFAAGSPLPDPSDALDGVFAGAES